MLQPFKLMKTIASTYEHAATLFSTSTVDSSYVCLTYYQVVKNKSYTAPTCLIIIYVTIVFVVTRVRPIPPYRCTCDRLFVLITAHYWFEYTNTSEHVKSGSHQNRTLTIHNHTFYIVQYRSYLFYC
jgi:hypothetical protein